MVYRIYPEKSNTISSGMFAQNLNAGLSSFVSFEYGGEGLNNVITRFLIQFDLTELQEMVNSYQINPNLVPSIGGYTLNMKNAAPKVKDFLTQEDLSNPNFVQKVPATSFQLIAAAVNQNWSQGRGVDIYGTKYVYVAPGNVILTGFSNWNSATTLNSWQYGPGVYNNITGQTPINYYGNQVFDLGDEDMSIDVTPIVNSWLFSGVPNNGLIVAYAQPYEQISGDTISVASFTTENTNSAFLPYLQVNSQQEFIDDRMNVTNNRICNLFLYVFSGNTPTNYYSASTVTIQSINGSNIITGLTPVQQQQGVYKISNWFSGLTPGNYKDVWSFSVNPPYDQQTVTQTFTVKQPQSVFAASPSVNAYSLSVYGLEDGMILSDSELVEIQCSLRANYSTEAPATPYTLMYRLVMNNQIELIPFTLINKSVINSTTVLSFNLNTSWLLTNQSYALQFQIVDRGTNRVLPDQINFRVINSF